MREPCKHCLSRDCDDPKCGDSTLRCEKCGRIAQATMTVYSSRYYSERRCHEPTDDAWIRLVAFHARPSVRPTRAPLPVRWFCSWLCSGGRGDSLRTHRARDRAHQQNPSQEDQSRYHVLRTEEDTAREWFQMAHPTLSWAAERREELARLIGMRFHAYA